MSPSTSIGAESAKQAVQTLIEKLKCLQDPQRQTLQSQIIRLESLVSSIEQGLFPIAEREFFGIRARIVAVIQTLKEEDSSLITTLENSFQETPLPHYLKKIFTIARITRAVLFPNYKPSLIPNVCKKLIQIKEPFQALDIAEDPTHSPIDQTYLLIQNCEKMIKNADYTTPPKIACSILDLEKRDSVLLEVANSLAAKNTLFLEALFLISEESKQQQARTTLIARLPIVNPGNPDLSIPNNHSYIFSYIKTLSEAPLEQTASSVLERVQTIVDLLSKNPLCKKMQLNLILIKEDLLRRFCLKLLKSKSPLEAIRVVQAISKNSFLRDNLLKAICDFFIQENEIEQAIETSNLISNPFLVGRVFFSTCKALIKKKEIQGVLSLKERICQQELRDCITKRVLIEIAKENKKEALKMAEKEPPSLRKAIIKSIYEASITKDNAKALISEVLAIENPSIKKETLQAIFQKLVFTIKDFDEAENLLSYFTSTDLPLKKKSLLQIFETQIAEKKFEEALIVLEKIEKEFSPLYNIVNPSPIEHLRFRALLRTKPFSEVCSLFSSIEKELVRNRNKEERDRILQEIYSFLLEENRFKDLVNFEKTISNITP